MQQIATFLKKARDVIAQKSNQTFNKMQEGLIQKEYQEDEEQPQTSIVPAVIGKEVSQTPIKELDQNEKVLQIDLIESGFIQRTQEVISGTEIQREPVQLHQKAQTQIVGSETPEQASRLNHIEQEKRSILQELKKLDNEIAEIKGQEVQDGALKRRQKQQENQQAAKHAKGLVKQLKIQKKEIEERKKKQTEKAYQIMIKQEEQRKARQVQEAERAKEERRRKIEARMEQDKKKRQERKLIQKESNRLLKQLKRQDDVFKQKEELPHETIQIETKKKVVQKKVEVNFRQIEDHERKYILRKEQEKQVKKQRAESVNHHVPQYKKNMWLQQIEEQQIKRKEQEQLKESMRKGQLEKRKKYGDLVKNIFIPKQLKRDYSSDQIRQKPVTPDAAMLPRIPQSQKRITDSKPMKKFIEQNRPFATAHNPKPPRPNIRQQKSPQDLQKQRQKKLKEFEMRKQTKQRLKKLQNRSMQKLPQSLSKPKYENYLGKVKVKMDNDVNSWKKVIDNESMTKEDKYKQMLKRAAAMENKAKVKEQVMKQGDDQAVNLYIGSIQAKLAILQKF